MFLDDQAIEKNQPLDTGTLTDLVDGAQWLRVNRGNHTVLFFNELPPFSGNFFGVRPFASAAGFASIAQIPWYRSEGLVGLKIRITARVSSALRDQESLAAISPKALFAAAWVSGESSEHEPMQAGPVPIVPEYQTVEFDFLFSQNVSNLYDVLSIQFFSVDDGDPYDPDLAANNTLGNALLQGPMRKNYIRVDKATNTYLDPPAPAPSNSVVYKGPNEISASVLGGTSDIAPEKPGAAYIGTVDHVVRWGDDDEMAVWPPVSALAGTSDPMRSARQVYKRSVGYVQFNQIEIEEVYA